MVALLATSLDDLVHENYIACFMYASVSYIELHILAEKGPGFFLYAGFFQSDSFPQENIFFLLFQS